VPGPEPSDDREKLLSLVKSQEGGFATAPEIEPQTEVGEKQTRNRLEKLYEEGFLNRRKVGSTNVYWLTDEGEQLLADALR
jgi:DNA-binding PadR family transcriptional regulator